MFPLTKLINYSLVILVIYMTNLTLFKTLVRLFPTKAWTHFNPLIQSLQILLFLDLENSSFSTITKLSLCYTTPVIGTQLTNITLQKTLSTTSGPTPHSQLFRHDSKAIKFTDMVHTSESLKTLQTYVLVKANPSTPSPTVFCYYYRIPRVHLWYEVLLHLFY